MILHHNLYMYSYEISSDKIYVINYTKSFFDTVERYMEYCWTF